MLIVIIACEDKKENDSTPPSVLITNIQANATLSAIASIKVDASDNDKIETVEFNIYMKISASGGFRIDETNLNY